jgi:Domain of unknown function (DUF6916)
MPDLSSLTAEQFAERLKETFALTAPGVAFDLVLVEVEKLGMARPGRNAFSLLFRGPAKPILPQAIYRIENPAMGAIELFLVPLGPRDGGICYEAVFT